MGLLVSLDYRVIDSLDDHHQLGLSLSSNQATCRGSGHGRVNAIFVLY